MTNVRKFFLSPLSLLTILAIGAFSIYFALTFNKVNTEDRSRASGTTCAVRQGCSTDHPGYGYRYTPTDFPTCSFGPPWPTWPNDYISTPLCGGGVSSSPTPTTSSVSGSTKKWYFNSGICMRTATTYASLADCQTSVQSTCYETFQVCAQAHAPTPTVTTPSGMSCPAGYQSNGVCETGGPPYTLARCCTQGTQSCTSCTACASAACGECSTTAPGWRCTCSGSCNGGYGTCGGVLDSSCGEAQPTPTSGAGQKMFYRNSLLEVCAETDLTFATTGDCHTSLSTYASSYYGGACYLTLDACNTAIGATPKFFFHTDRLSCVKTTQAYRTIATCEENLQIHNAGKTARICYDTERKCLDAMYYFHNDFSACVGTRDSYESVDACRASLATNLPGKTGGNCYTSYEACKSAKRSDLDFDGDVDIFDYNILVGNFGKTGAPGFIPSDIDKNGEVDIFDYNILVTDFQASQ